MLPVMGGRGSIWLRGVLMYGHPLQKENWINPNATWDGGGFNLAERCPDVWSSTAERYLD